MVNPRPRVIHMTTSHLADDVRIYERECRSLVEVGGYEVLLAAGGPAPKASTVEFLPMSAPADQRLPRLALGLKRAYFLASTLTFDLWHFHDPELLPVAVYLARRGENVIWDAHEDYLEQFSDSHSRDWVPSPLRGLVQRGTAYLIRQVDEKASGVVAATPSIAAGYSNPRTVIVGNEARLEAFAGCEPDFDSREVLFTGQVGPGHLFGQLVTAVSMIPDVFLTVAGRTPDPHAWQQAQDLLGERIRHLGWLDRIQLASTMNSSALGTSLYEDLPTNRNNSPNKLYEFCAAGLPVVASPNESNVKFVDAGAGGFLATDYTGPGLSAAIELALSDRVRWESASQEGRAWAQKVGSWTPSESRLIGLYQQILGV